MLQDGTFQIDRLESLLTEVGLFPHMLYAYAADLTCLMQFVLSYMIWHAKHFTIRNLM